MHRKASWKRFLDRSCPAGPVPWGSRHAQLDCVMQKMTRVSIQIRFSAVTPRRIWKFYQKEKNDMKKLTIQQLCVLAFAAVLNIVGASVATGRRLFYRPQPLPGL